jgi:uncharacterized membrane protein
VTRAVREALAARGVGSRDGFRWRGHEVTRVEGFSDAVFAFAVTLLVVSLEVPKTFGELQDVMRGFLPFAVCFALLLIVWREHYVYFRRYGLQDNVVIWLNAALLFVVLFYVYPLKFVFTLALAPLTGMHTVVTTHAGATERMIEPVEIPRLFVIYGAGLISIYVLIAAMYFHAWRRRALLELSPLEEFDTRASIVASLLGASIGVVSVVIALVVRPEAAGLAGFVYFLFGPVMAAYGTLSGKRRRRFEARAVDSP